MQQFAISEATLLAWNSMDGESFCVDSNQGSVAHLSEVNQESITSRGKEDKNVLNTANVGDLYASPAFKHPCMVASKKHSNTYKLATWQTGGFKQHIELNVYRLVVLSETGDDGMTIAASGCFQAMFNSSFSHTQKSRLVEFMLL